MNNTPGEWHIEAENEPPYCRYRYVTSPAFEGGVTICVMMVPVSARDGPGFCTGWMAHTWRLTRA